MFSCHLSLISSASVRSLPFLSFILTVFAWRYPLISPIFLKIFSLSNLHCVYLFISISIYLLAFISIFHLRRLSYLSLLFSGTLHSDGYIFLSLSPLPFASLLSSAIYKASSHNHFAILHFLLFGMVWVTASYTEYNSIHSFSSTSSMKSNPLICSSPPV